MQPLTPTQYSCRVDFFTGAMAALAITVPWFWLTWQYGFDLADEGFYWYGAQRVLAGEVPLRDFMSYDIGRYYWVAAFMYLMDDTGPFAARLSAVVYQFFGTTLGVFLCLMALRRDRTARWLFGLLAASILTLWVQPYYKVYDHATSICIVALLVLMLKKTTPVAWFTAGVLLGVAAIVGRNHGVYGAVASIFVMTVLFVKTPSRQTLAVACGYFALGVLVGFFPMLIMMVVVDGFAAAFLDSIISMFKYGATNIARPIPWPWSEDLVGLGFFWAALRILPGIGFLLLLAFPLFGIFLFSITRFDLSSDARKVLLATIAASIPYAHYAFSRADLTHLALGIYPVLIGLLVVGSLMKRALPLVLAVGLLAATLGTFVTNNDYLSNSIIRGNSVKANIGGEQLWIHRGVLEKLQLITEVLQELTSSSDIFLALPNMPSVHAIFRTQMPIWEIYPLFPRDKDFEVAEIRRLESNLPKVIFLSDHALDGNPKFRYSQMHPLTYEWITSNYTFSDRIKDKWNTSLDVYLLRH